MEYLDFELEISGDIGRQYTLTVIDSPAGEARTKMLFPLDELALQSSLKDLQIALLRSGGLRRKLLTSEEQSVRDFGSKLFDAAISGEVRSRYDVSRREATGQGMGLRLKLRIQAPELAVLPWEFMYDDRDGEYICLSRNLPLVRYLEVAQPVKPLVIELPIRLLGMVAAPQNLPHLDIEHEKKRLEEAIKPLHQYGLLELTWLQGQTWRSLQEALQGGPWHAFHFVGHGGFDENTREGMLALANETGNTHFMSATQLARLLGDHPSLRLALLNSCEGAHSEDQDIFASTAAMLVRRGIPAVIAMQYEITDRAAVEFSRSFYTALARGLPIDAAVAEARKAISLAVNNTIEWGTPVLYMRAHDGRLFNITNRGTDLPFPPAASIVSEQELQQRLADLHLKALGEYYSESYEQASHTFQAIIDLKPEYKDAREYLEKSRGFARREALYSQAQQAIQEKDWDVAFALLVDLEKDFPGYKDISRQLEVVKRQKQCSDLYTTASRLSEAGQWQAIVNIFAEIHAIDANFPDPKKLLLQAQQEIQKKQNTESLKNDYQQALFEIKAERWAEAQKRLEAVQAQHTGYEMTEQLLDRAKKEINRQKWLEKHYMEGMEAFRLQDWEQAIQFLRLVVEESPSYQDAAERLEKAKKQFDSVHITPGVDRPGKNVVFPAPATSPPTQDTKTASGSQAYKLGVFWKRWWRVVLIAVALISWYLYIPNIFSISGFLLLPLVVDHAKHRRWGRAIYFLLISIFWFLLRFGIRF